MQYRHDSSETGKLHVAWVQSWNTFLKELRVLIKNHHTTGLTWNASGGDAASFAGAAPAPSSGGPPPPGPPPPPVVVASAGKQVDHSALFAEIEAVKERQKSGKTEGLKHVTKDMKAPKGGSSAPVPAVAPKKGSTPAPKKAAITKPPKFELEGNKWIVENQVGNHSLVIGEPEPKHAVYVYKCDDSVLQIKGKVNTITIDSCHKTAVVFDTAISSVEVVNCSGIQVQVTGKVPSVQVDKTTGAQIFVSNNSLEVEIVTSKSDAMNVVLPPKNDGDDIEEIAIPEQFKTTIANRKLVTEAVAHV